MGEAPSQHLSSLLSEVTPQADLTGDGIRALELACHIARRRELESVDGSSLLLATVAIDPQVESALSRARLEVRQWEALTRIDRARALALAEEAPGTLLTRGLAPLVSAMTSRYLGPFDSRPLDALGIAFGIVAADGDIALPVEERAGLDRSAAVNSLRTAILSQARLFEISPDRFSFSSRAGRVVFSSAPSHEVPHGTSTLLLGFLLTDWAGEDTAADVLQQRAQERRSRDPSFETKVQQWREWYRHQPPWLRGQDLVTDYAAGCLERAQEIAHSVRGETTIHSRDLIAALLSYDPGYGRFVPGVRDLLEELGLSRQVLIDDLLAYLEAHAPPSEADDLNAWRLVFDPNQPLLQSVPHYDAESLEGPDLLDITRHVHAFANLLASRTLEPPLAVGLFGEWGSGKSFFMRKLQQRILTLAEASRTAPTTTAFHSSVIQIDFNAWHYVDTNLWASLVTHIFESLHRHFAPKQDDEQREWEQLLHKLDQAFDLHTDAEQSLATATRRLAEAQEERQQVRIQLLDAVKAVWEALEQEPAIGKPLAKAKKRLGAETVRELREQLLLRRSDGEVLLARLPLFRQAVLRGLGNLASLGTAGVVALVVTAAAVALAAVGTPVVERAVTGLGQVVAAVGAVASWLGVAFRRASGAMDAVEQIEQNLGDTLGKLTARHPALQNLREAEQAVVMADEAVAEHRRRIAELQAQARELRPSQRLSNFLQERARSSDYRQHLGLAALIRRDFERLHHLLRPQEFILDLASAADLDRHRIPETLRREIRRHDVPFERDHQAPTEGSDGEASEPAIDSAAETAVGVQPPTKAEESASQAVVQVVLPGREWRINDDVNSRHIDIRRRRLGDEEQLACTLTWNLPKIDRIVLYVDDLDRCPPHRVVEVLQAVHLLLAFPLFVVVMAVDARWVSRSLSLRFRQLWRQSDGDERNALSTGPAATPHDYLEKIFQVPFWLEPMSAVDTAEYLAGLLASSLAQPAVEAATAAGLSGAEALPAGSPLQSAASDGQPPNGGTEPATGPEPSGGPEAATDAGPPPSADIDGRTPSSSETLVSPMIVGPASRGVEAQELNPDSLILQAVELAFMQHLAPLIGRSPRAVKRYVNVYRLIRAGVPRARLASFVGTADSPGPYRSVLFLLALTVGAPTVADLLFDEIRRGNPTDSLSGLLRNLGQHPHVAPEDWARIDTLLRDRPERTIDQISSRHLVDYRREVGRFSFRVGRS